MADDKIIEIMEKVKKDPGFSSEARKLAEAGDREGIVRLYSETAKRLGFELSESDITGADEEAAKCRAEKTDEAVSCIESLSDEELDEVSGGGNHKECSDTFKDRENCWFNDGCDVTITDYSGYICHSNHDDGKCKHLGGLHCQAVFFPGDRK